jgi:hypothetical protein
MARRRSNWGQGRIREAYQAMAELGYRPKAPSDGFGNITVPLSQLDLEAEVRRYSEDFTAEEDKGLYQAGCTNGSSMKAAIWTLEAFRLMNGGIFWDLDDDKGRQLVPKLLRMAAEEYEQAHEQ